MKRSFLVWIYFVLVGNLGFANTNLNIGVFGGGGVNAYAALYLAEEFLKTADMPFHELFDQGWGLSGGTFSAQILMDGRWHGRASAIAKTQMETAFPNYSEFIDPIDKAGLRGKKFEKALELYFSNQYFSAEKKSNAVFIGSQKGLPVFFCNNDVQLPSHELRCTEGTSVIDGIMCSSTYSYRFLGMPSAQLSLFKPRQILVSPIMEKRTIVDGSHCFPKRKGKYVLDGVTPTPLVIDYLLSFPGQHNIVVFDNGGPYNDDFRKSIGLNESGIANINHGDTRVTIFILSITVRKFAFNLLNSSQEYVEYLERQVHKALNGQSKTAFWSAIRAVVENRVQRPKSDSVNTPTKGALGKTSFHAKL